MEKVLEGGNEVYQLSALVGEEEVLNLAEQKKRARFMAVLNEPVFFNLINADQISLSLWGSFAIRNGFERSTVLLLKKYPLSSIDSILLIQLTVESCLQSRLSILPVLSERLAKEKIQIPYSVLIFAAKQFLKDSDRDDFEYFQSSQIILEMENLLPPSKEIRLRFLSETLQFSLYDIRICLNILRKFETLYISDLNINWNVIDNEKRFNDLIYGLASINKLLDRNGVVYQPLLESAIMKDYISSFISLINIGTNIPISSLFHLASMKNSIGCAKILISQDQSLIRSKGMLFLRNAILFDNVDIVSWLFSNYHIRIDLSEVMYYAIYCDSPYCLEVILKFVRSDQESLKRAITKLGTKRTASGKTCLDLLLQSNETVLKAIEISNQAVRQVGNFVQMQHA